MPVTLLQSGYYRHRKMIAANRITGGELAEVMWTRLLDYANELETGGRIDAGVPEFVCPRQTDKRVAALVAVGLLDVIDDHWEIHDYYEWNRTTAELEALKAARSAAGRAGAAARWGGRLPNGRANANGKAAL